MHLSHFFVKLATNVWFLFVKEGVLWYNVCEGLRTGSN